MKVGNALKKNNNNNNNPQGNSNQNNQSSHKQISILSKTNQLLVETSDIDGPLDNLMSDRSKKNSSHSLWKPVSKN